MSVAFAPAAPPGFATMADEDIGTVTGRIFADIMRMAKTICANTRTPDGKQMNVTAYLDSKLRDPVTKDYKATLRRMAKDDN